MKYRTLMTGYLFAISTDTIDLSDLQPCVFLDLWLPIFLSESVGCKKDQRAARKVCYFFTDLFLTKLFCKAEELAPHIYRVMFSALR